MPRRRWGGAGGQNVPPECGGQLGPWSRGQPACAAAGLVSGRPQVALGGTVVAGQSLIRGRGLSPFCQSTLRGGAGAAHGQTADRCDRRWAAAMATAMAATAAERTVLEEEFRWLLHAEVHAVLRQLQDILKEASLRFTLPGSGTEGPAKQENFILGSCGTDQVKGVLTLQGDALSQADVNLKMPRNNQLLHLAFREDKQWKLQQIQDARNHVSQAIYLLANRDENYQFKTGAEVLKLMDAVMLQLTRARNRLTTPATLTLPEIAASGLTVSASGSPHTKRGVPPTGPACPLERTQVPTPNCRGLNCVSVVYGNTVVTVTLCPPPMCCSALGHGSKPNSTGGSQGTWESLETLVPGAGLGWVLGA
nr:protein rogdi homolog isoform X4 [Marmota flaviventris]